MKVLMLGWEFPPFFAGGVGIVSAALARAMADQGVEVAYLMPVGPDEVTDGCFRLIVAARRGPRIRVGRVASLIQPYDGTAPWPQFGGPLSLTTGSPAPRPRLYGPELLAEVERFALEAAHLASSSELEFDVVHAHDWTTWPAANAIKERTGVPLVVHVHITEFDKSGNSGADPRVYAIERAGMQVADLVLAVSRRVAGACVERYGVDPAKIRVIHNALDPLGAGSRPRASRTRTVLFLGRVTLQKGPDYFLEAARRVLEFDPDVRFVVAGSGDMWAGMIERAAALGIGDRVVFAGFVHREELADLMATADLFIMPSVSEPFGIVALEAMEAGIPVIVSRQSGVSELVHHALKADFWDVEDIAAKILAVLAYPSLADELGRAGPTEARSRTWSMVADEIGACYREIMV